MTHGNVTGIPPSRGRKRGFPRRSPGTEEASRPVRGGSGRERSRDRSRRRGEWPRSEAWVAETRAGRAGAGPVTGGAPGLESGICAHTHAAHAQEPDTRTHTSTLVQRHADPHRCRRVHSITHGLRFARTHTCKHTHPLSGAWTHTLHAQTQRDVRRCPYTPRPAQTCAQPGKCKLAHLLPARRPAHGLKLHCAQHLCWRRTLSHRPWARSGARAPIASAEWE